MKKKTTCETFAFQLQLLLHINELGKYPFTKLVIDRGLSEEEYNRTLGLVEELNRTYIREQEEGLLHHDALLIHFAGMLCYKLPVQESLDALYQEGYYPDLMKKLIELSHT